jgi:hypothetical protein
MQPDAHFTRTWQFAIRFAAFQPLLLKLLALPLLLLRRLALRHLLLVLR